MARYHTSDDNIPRICTAQPGNCPVGKSGGHHFKNLGEARSYLALQEDALKPHYALNHEDEIKNIHTRFYAFRGAWGDHQLIIVDTKLEREYELTIKDGEEVADRAKAAVEIYGRVTEGTKDLFAPSYSKLGYHSRQCFNQGIGYSEVPMAIEQHPSYVSKKNPSHKELLDDPNMMVESALEDARQSVEADKKYGSLKTNKLSSKLTAVDIANDVHPDEPYDLDDPAIRQALRDRAAATVEASQARRVRRAKRVTAEEKL